MEPPTRKRGRPSKVAGRVGRPKVSRRDLLNSHDRVEADSRITGTGAGRPHKYEHLAGSRNFKPIFYTVGMMNVLCPHDFCRAVHFEGEKIGSSKKFHFSSCCHNGQVKLPDECQFKTLPTNIQELWTEDSPVAISFRKDARMYNLCFQFASFTSNQVQFKNGGPPVFKIQGQIYHRVSHFSGDGCKFGQVYMLDTEEALNQRSEEHTSLNPSILKELQEAIMQNNLIAHDYRKMKDVHDEELSKSKREGRPTRELAMVFRSLDGDQRRKNLPASDEIAAVFLDENGEPPSNIHFAIYPRGDFNGMRTLPQVSRMIDPMVYPILFLNGERGWTFGMSKNVQKEDSEGYLKITQLQYFSSRFSVRPNVLNPVHRAGKLTQQYAVDGYVRVEGQRLRYLKENQQDLRVESYKGLIDHLANDNQRTGRRVILPSSFIGSPRAMAQNFQDAMAIVSVKGTPSLFITVTCNHKDPDIVKNLYAGQKASDRPDIVARVFHLKVKEIEKDIYKRKIFGDVIGMVYVVEYQKRGLPHIHILAILHPDDKQRIMDNIDCYVRAELPNKDIEPELYEIVTSNMIHTPCNAINAKCPCKVVDKRSGIPICTKEFPKPLSETTVLNCNGFPKYRRRPIEPVIMTLRKEQHEIDNKWVVPFNPYLLLKYRCHINTELCATVASVKYLYKYIFKGHDQANLEVHQLEKDENGSIVKDEITDYINSRYVSPTEAMWRLFEYRLDFTSHTIYRLPVHLPNDQPICFHDGHETEAVDTAPLKISKLMAFFKLNENDPEARQHFYRDIPQYYTYDLSKRRWNKRKYSGESTIGRMYSVSPQDRELYFLRLLLLNVRGPTSFDYLKTVEGNLYESFFEAARARDLCHSDDLWRDTLLEAQNFQTGSLLRQLFVTICVFCEPSDPRLLFEEFYDVLSEDFDHKNSGLNDQDLLNHVLWDLDYRFRLLGKTNESFYLQTPSGNPQIRDNFSSIEQRERGIKTKGTLNKEQRTIYDEVIRNIESRNRKVPNVFFLNGPAGTGKTHVYHALSQTVRGGCGTVICVAYSGIAASLLEGGKTVNSTFGIPLSLTAESVSSIKVNSQQAKYLKSAALIIWDEAPMVHRHMLECVDRLLRDIADDESKNVPFGGQTIVLGGDFRQTLPIVAHGKIGDDLKASIKRSDLWIHAKIHHLTKNMRVGAGESDFAMFLKRLGDGEILIEDGRYSIKIPDDRISFNLIKDVFDDKFDDPDETSKKAILCPTNQFCNEFNEDIINRLPGKLLEFFSIDRAINDEGLDDGAFQPEFLHAQTVGGLPPHILKLKVGAIVMLLRNLDPKVGLINGTRMVVVKASRHCLQCRILTGAAAGQIALIPKIKLQSCSSDLPFKLERQQFPVRLSYAMTINKSQGQSLDRVGLHLVNPVFSHGQLYVAFSRCRTYSGIFIQLQKTQDEDVKLSTDNVVYPDALL